MLDKATRRLKKINVKTSFYFTLFVIFGYVASNKFLFNDKYSISVAKLFVVIFIISLVVDLILISIKDKKELDKLKGRSPPKRWSI